MIIVKANDTNIQQNNNIFFESFFLILVFTGLIMIVFVENELWL